MNHKNYCSFQWLTPKTAKRPITVETVTYIYLYAHYLLSNSSSFSFLFYCIFFAHFHSTPFIFFVLSFRRFPHLWPLLAFAPFQNRISLALCCSYAAVLGDTHKPILCKCNTNKRWQSEWVSVIFRYARAKLNCNKSFIFLRVEGKCEYITTKNSKKK